MKKVFKYLFENIKKYIWKIMFGLLLFLLIEVSAILTPIFFGKFIDALIASKPTWYHYVIMSVVVSLMGRLLYYLFAILELNTFIFQIQREIKKDAFDKLSQFSIGQFYTKNSGEIQSVIGRGTAQAWRMVRLFIYDVFPSVAYIVVALVFMFQISWIFALISSVSAMVILGFVTRLIHLFGPRLLKDQGLWQKLDKYQSEILRNFVGIRLSYKENLVSESYNDRMIETEKFSRQTWKSYLVKKIPLDIIQVFSTFIFLSLGGIFVLKDNLSIGTLVILCTWSNQVISKSALLRRLGTEFSRNMPPLQKYVELVTETPLIKETGVIEKISFGKIEFSNVNFNYDHTTNGLKKINLTIRPGEKIGLVGPSGAGKSTLIKLLLRVADPDTGGVFIDNKPLPDYKSSYRRDVGYVAQDIQLFDESVRYNLTLGEDYTNEQLLSVLEEVQLSEKISDVCDLDQVIGERGIRLSGGEQQRLIIAQTMLKKPKILIFDEATSSLDAKSQKTVQEAINRVSRGVTTIIIAHRLSTVRNCDRIIFMQNGEIKNVAPFDELIKINTHFAEAALLEGYHQN